MTRERFMDYVAEYLWVEKYEEFKIKNNNRKNNDRKYRVTNESIEVNSIGIWVRTIMAFDYFYKERVIKLPWKPKRDEKYWFIDMTIEAGIYFFHNRNTVVDKRIMKRGEIFKTEEQALERVKELGW